MKRYTTFHLYWASVCFIWALLLALVVCSCRTAKKQTENSLIETQSTSRMERHATVHAGKALNAERAQEAWRNATIEFTKTEYTDGTEQTTLQADTTPTKGRAIKSITTGTARLNSHSTDTQTTQEQTDIDATTQRTDTTANKSNQIQQTSKETTRQSSLRRMLLFAALVAIAIYLFIILHQRFSNKT